MQNVPLIVGVRPLNLPSGAGALEENLGQIQPPQFPRSPRDYVPYPDDEISIQLPPAEPTLPGVSLITILMPVLGVMIMVGFSIYSAQARETGQTGSFPIYALLSVPMALASVSVGIANFMQARKKYKQQVALRLSAYNQYLAQKEAEAKDAAQRQQVASLSAHPDLDQCFAYAKSCTPTKLWDRENGDPDFMEIRLGVGQVPATYNFKIPDASQFQITPDPLEQRARKLAETYSLVSDAVVALPLANLGAAGWVGKHDAILQAVRASLLHLISHHAPNEVKIVVLANEQDAREWDWIRWLPHNWSEGHQVRFFGSSAQSKSNVLNYIEGILKNRDNQASSSPDSENLPIPTFVIVWADVQLWRGREAVKFAPVLDLILKSGKKLGAFSLFLSEQISRVPKSCEAIIDIDGRTSSIKYLGIKPRKYMFLTDLAEKSLAWQFANSLAPVRIEDAGGEASNLPASVTLMELIGASRVENIDVMSLWTQSEPSRSLAVPIGIGAGGKRLLLNLHEKAHGPHGLVAGTTGSGKTALLSTFLALAALHYHPHELGFIGIDFKGGDLIRELKELPHMIGALTNLDGSGTERAIKLLRGEIKKRQNLFNQAGIGNIYDYQGRHRKGDPEALSPMPHLVIVCDEFAELKKEQPDFIRELISISRVGRSLGIHLILATQKPAGVVSDEIWSNSHFHLCLKVASLEDSREMLRRPEAAEITQQGRAYFQVGMNEVFELFQAAWGDAPYTPVDEAAGRQVSIKIVSPEGQRQKIWPPQNAAESSGQTQIQALVKHILAVCALNNIKRLTGIWPADLSEKSGTVLDDLLAPGQGWDGKYWTNTGGPVAPLIGLKDDPDHQRQEHLRIDLEGNGHFAIFGSPGSGKTTLLQTLIAGLTRQHTPEQVHFYLLDFSGRNLNAFEEMPHVGAVITLGENERLRRLFVLLNEEIERRKVLVEQDQTLARYKLNHPGHSEAEIVVVLDGYSHFAEAFKLQTLTTEIDNLVRLVSQGGNLGLHLIVTTDQVKTFPSKLLGNIKDIAAMEMNDHNDYVNVIGRTGGLFPPKDSPGRGLIKGAPVLEFQAALPAESSLALRKLAEEMKKSWKGKPLPTQVPVLPDQLTVDEAIQARSQPRAMKDTLPLGLNLARPDLSPSEITLSRGPHFWIAGLPQSGKTTLLQTFLLTLAELYEPSALRFFIVDLGWGNLEAIKGLPHSLQCITDAADFRAGPLQDQLQGYLDIDHTGSRLVPLNDPARPTVVFAIDGLGLLQKSFAGDRTAEKNRDYLVSLLRVRNARFHMIAAGMGTEFGGGMTTNPLGETLRSYQSGFWVGDGSNADASNFNFQFAPGETLKGLPKGLGFYVNRGKYTPMKFASCHSGVPLMEERIEKIQQRYKQP